MSGMPGKSWSGELPPLTEAEGEIARNLERHVRLLTDTIGERNVGRRYDALRRAEGEIVRIFAGLGYEPRRQPYRCAGVEVANVAIEIAGTRPGPVVVVGAHYDSVEGTAGANDNGSGVAALLELARLLAGRRLQVGLHLVAFVNEEPPWSWGPLMGSVVYAGELKRRGVEVAGMISLETIGYYSDEEGSQNFPVPGMERLYPTRGNFIAFVGNEESAEWVREVTGRFRAAARFPSEGIAAPGEIAGIGWSDHWSFWREGWPALMVTDTAPFRYPFYHDPADTYDKVDYARVARVTAGLARVVAECCGAEEV